MAQHKTIDRRKAATDAQSVARRLAEQKRAQPTAPAARTAATPATGGYHSPREYGGQRDFYEARVATTRNAMERQQAAFREAQRALEQLNRQAQEKRQRYYDLHGTFEGDTAQQYEDRIMAEWTEAVDLYDQGKQSWQKAYDAYKPYEDAYNAAIGEYNTYMAGEQAAYDGWKATIRGADEIREEQKGIKAKRAELQRRMQMANDIASGTAAPGIMAQAAQNEAAIRELQEYLGGAGDREKLLQEELDWSEHFRFEDLRQNADFAQKSRYVSSGTGEGLKVDPTTGQVYGSQVGDRQYEVVNRNAAALGEQAMGDINNEWGHLQTMTDDEIAMYNYLYATRGPQGAAEYLGHLRQALTARQMEGYNELIGQTVEAGGVPGAVLASAGSLLLSPFAGMQTALGQVGYKLAGQEIDPNAGYALGTHTKNALRQSVSEKIEENAGPVGSFAYQTVMSMGDMLMDATIGGPAAMALIGTRGFSEGVIDAKHRGLSDGQALSLGAVAGLAEVLLEKLGVDERLRLPEKWKTAGFWKGALHGAIGEGSEEALTNIVNLVADLTVAGEESEFMRTVRENMAQQTMPDGSVKTGMSEEEATKKAVWAALGSVGLDFLGGAVSGGVFGGWNGWQGKKAEGAKEKAGEKTESVSFEKEAVSFENGAEIKRYAKDAGEEAPSVAEGDSSPTQSAGEPLGVAAQSSEGDVQKTGDGASLEKLKEAAIMRRNPAVTKVMLTAQDEELMRRIEKATSKTEVTALDRGLGDEDAAMLLRLRELTGREIIVEEYNEDFYGYLDRASGEIHISAGNGNMMAQTFGHELTHTIEGTTGWDKLLGLVQKRTQEEGKSWGDLRKAKIAFHESHGQTLTEKDADAEIVARYVEQHLLTDEKAIRQMVRDDRSMARRVLDWLDSIWAKVAKTEGARERQFIREAREHYRNALQEAGENRKRQETYRGMVTAYEDGDDEAGDALFEEYYGTRPDALLEDPTGDLDPSEDWKIPFSFAGEGAKNADREALERAKEMESRGLDRREIRRATGWFRGADQKWRFEIDDSRMKYHRGGDAQFRRDHPEYRQYRELERKFLDGTITEAEVDRLQELSGTWFREGARLGQRVRTGNATLANVLDHEALFEAYPALSAVRVRFGDTDGMDANGWWDKDRNEIVISDRFRQADEGYLEGLLLHEIQHAIQDMEGFTGGANIEHWRQVQEGNYPVGENDRQLRQAQRDADKALNRVPLEVRKDFWVAANLAETDPEARELAERLRQGEYAEEFDDYEWYTSEVKEYTYNNPRRDARELYRNTAGEIEARDTANRRGMTGEERRGWHPNTGDERTVFAEKGGRQYSLKGEDSEGRELSAEQQEFFRDSKVRVDEDGEYWYGEGRLVPVYHETNADFTVFLKKYLGQNTDGNASNNAYAATAHLGFWFNTNDLSKGEKAIADKNIEAYLNVTNPYDAGTLWGLAVQIAEGYDEDTSPTRMAKEFVKQLKAEGYDGVVIRDEEYGGLSFAAFESNQIKRTDNLKPTERKDIRFSFKGEENEDDGVNGFTEGYYADDEAARAAHLEGYPVINGVQVVPMKTYVHNTGIMRDKAGNPVLDKDGNPRRWDNYGLVAGLGSKPGTLKVNFHNKHEYNEYYGGTIRRDGVEVALEDLTPTPGVFQRTEEDFESLVGQAPEEPGSYDYSQEELDEIEALRSRAEMEEEGTPERPTWTALEPETMAPKLRRGYDREVRKTAEAVAQSLGVPRGAKKEFLVPLAEELCREYMQHGTVSADVRDRLFEKGWREAIVQNKEFYETYKEVKDYLRTTAFTLGETDRDSLNWDDIKRRAVGTVLLKNEGGLPVDTAWGELREKAPELFPEDIYNPADMLERMIEVGKSIKPQEQSLEERYGPDAAYAKQMERMDFDAAVQQTVRELWKIRRIADDLAAEATPVTAEGEDGAVALTQEQVAAMYPALKETRRNLEKAVAKAKLSKRDREQVQRLLRHDIQPEHLDPARDNKEDILRVWEAKKAFEEAAEPIRKWNRQQKAKNLRLAEGLLDGVRLVDKKLGAAYSRETMARNFRDVVKDEKRAEEFVKTYVKPVQEASAEAIRMQNRYRDRVRALELSRKVKKGDHVSEAYAVQFYGEVSDILRVLREQEARLKKPNPRRLAARVRDGKTYAEWQEELRKLWEENPGLDRGKIENAAREFGRIYEELFEQMNEVRVRNGYEPVNHRSGYFPHFQQDGRDGLMAQFGKALGIDVEVQQLPTTINGLTHTFKPGIRWFGNALERKSFDTAYDAVEGFDRYIVGVSDVVCHTDNIQRLRALATQIRYRTGDEGLREQIRKIQERTDLSEDDKEALIRERYEQGKFELSNFVVELDEYTNLLANKKSRADRNMEQAMGRDMYNLVKALESRAAANMVAINPGSWLTNFIPITQGWAALDTRTLLKGMWDTVLAVKNDDGMVDRSAFLTGRKGTEALVQTGTQKVGNVLSTPMEWIDGFTAGALVRARYAQNRGLGLSESEAMSEADEWAAGVMADRTKGAMPTVFHRSNPITKLFTQFQLEVNNQLSYIFKDLPREKRKKGVAALAVALLKLAVGAWLINELYEKVLGRRPALDPIDMAFGFVEDWADPELDFADAAMGLGEKIAENTPFIGGLLGGGRVPISSALPNAENLLKAVGNKEWSGKKRIATAAKELAKPAVYMLPPFGGGQVKKIWEGLKMIRQGGSYTVDADGNPMLQYTLYSTDNAVQKALEAGQAMIFGKTTIRSGREWVEGGFKTLSAEQTATYQALIAMDVEQADAFELLTGLRSAEKAGDKPRTAVQRDILRASGLEGDALATVYYDLMVDDGSKEKALLESLQKSGADMGRVASCLMDMKDADLLEGAAGSNAMRDALRASGLTDGQKQEIYHTRISDDRDDDIETFRKAGMDMDDFLEVQNQYTTIKESYEDEGDMATAFARWVNGRSYTKEQKAVARECFKYWNMIPANADRYDKAMEAGLSDEDAFELTEKLNELEPPEGKTSVQQIQKWRVGIDNAWGPENQLRQLKAVDMDDAAYAKCEALWNAGVAPAAYVRAQEIKDQFDTDGNGSLTNEDWTKLVNSLVPSGIALPGDNERFNMTSEQMGFLWQMLTGSKSTKNNPFSKTGGEKWLEIKNADK